MLYKRIVCKVGTSTLTYPNGRLNLRRIETLSHALDRAEAEAEAEAKQARVIRVSGVLIGAGLAIVLW